MSEENSNDDREVESVEVDLTTGVEPVIIVESGKEYDIILERAEFDFSI